MCTKNIPSPPSSALQAVRKVQVVARTGHILPPFCRPFKRPSRCISIFGREIILTLLRTFKRPSRCTSILGYPTFFGFSLSSDPEVSSAFHFARTIIALFLPLAPDRMSLHLPVAYCTIHFPGLPTLLFSEVSCGHAREALQSASPDWAKSRWIRL